MSEKIFALLLRLYPARFRARYGEESLQLLRDRFHHETGIPARLRLLFDLLTDSAVALPRAYRSLAPAASPRALASPGSLPSFSTLEPHSLRPATLLLAAIFGITATSGFALLLRYAGINHASRLAAIEADAAAHRRWTNGGFLGRPAPPPPPPPAYDLLETPPTTNPPSLVLHPHDAGAPTAPADSASPHRPAAHAPTPRPSANNARPTGNQALTPLLMVPALAPDGGSAPAIPLPALEKQFGIRPDTTPRRATNGAPARALPAPSFPEPVGRRSIVVLNPTTELPPCPATTSETGSNSSTKPASSAASARKSPPCSKLPKSPTASASPGSAAPPK